MQADAIDRKREWFRFDLNLDTPFGFVAAFGLSLFLQYCWLHYFLGASIGQLHLIPGSITQLLVTAFAALAWKSTTRQHLFLLGYTVLALRLPVSVSEVFLWPVWLVALGQFGWILHWCYRKLATEGTGRYLLLAAGIVLFNAFTHLGLESPFTHTFRLIVNESADYHGVDNDQSWICAYDGTPHAVQCDARHFIASELIFTDTDYDPSFSVVLSRFYHGYLNSLLGTDGWRWHASLAVNIFSWLLAVLALFRLCRLTQLPEVVAGAVVLSAASAWGFVSMVAQPGPYLLSFAFSLYALWAATEWVLSEDRCLLKRVLLLSVSILSIAVYEAYPISLACVLLLAFYRHYTAATLLVMGQIMLVLVWKKVGLEMIVGTAGDLNSLSSGISNISHDIRTWLSAVANLDFIKVATFIGIGTLAWLFGNLIIGAVAGGYTLVRHRYLALQRGKPSQVFWLLLLLTNLLVLAAMIFIVPQTLHWSPQTGMQPRLAFFSFGINLIALCYLFSVCKPRYLWAIPVAFLVLANIDKTGFASIAMLFDYGAIGLYWY